MKKLSSRFENIETGIFALLTHKHNELVSQGRKVYDFFVGTPDFEVDKDIRDAVCRAVSDPETYKYSLIDSQEMLDAVVDYYARRFKTEISADEVTSSNGAQDGLCHIGMAMCDPGDVVLLPDPGYPAFEASAVFGGADVYHYPLLRENNFLPNMKDIPEDVLLKTKYMIVSYPSNPCGAAAPREMYEELIGYALKYGFYIVNDNAYSDIIFDGREGFSFLSIPGAKDVGVEFFSLSKSFNLTGARIAFCVGNKRIVDTLKRVRSQYDLGMFMAVQKAAVAALHQELEKPQAQCLKYQERRDALCSGLREIGWDVPDSAGTMFVWAPIPPKFSSTQEFWEALVDRTGIICTPGTAFGPSGEGYVRFALIYPPEELKGLARIIDESGLLK